MSQKVVLVWLVLFLSPIPLSQRLYSVFVANSAISKVVFFRCSEVVGGLPLQYQQDNPPSDLPSVCKLDIGYRLKIAEMPSLVTWLCKI